MLQEFENKMQSFESLVASAEERYRHLDVTVRSKAQIGEISQTIQVSNSELLYVFFFNYVLSKEHKIIK